MLELVRGSRLDSMVEVTQDYARDVDDLHKGMACPIIGIRIMYVLHSPWWNITKEIQKDLGEPFGGRTKV